MSLRLLTAALLGLAPLPALAADPVMDFPAACRAAAPAPAAAKGMPMAGGGHAGHGAAPLEHQQAAMAGMATMDRDMGAAMLQADPDVAFVCGMIAHHQGAIAMSEVELNYGKDAFARDMAAKVIAAQKQEILDMKAWVDKRGR
jgi:uncharacterized protein (DUF305 family)